MSFFLLKASADRLPLADNSAGLVIATPPYLGARALRRHEYGVQQASEYDRLMVKFFSEASRVVKPGGTIVLHTNYPAVFRPQRKGPVVFTVHRKHGHGSRRRLQALKPVAFPTRHVYLKDFSWPVLPVWVYRSLIENYSRLGELVVHVFSGSGSGGVAALELGRQVALIDLHYHRQVRRRLRRKSPRWNR